MKNYLIRLFNDASGEPSAKRYMCVAFGVAAVAFAALGFGAEIAGIFLAAALGENVASVFEKGGAK